VKQLIARVFAHEALAAKPPVLLDIGASGSLPDVWKALAPHSICVAFDADDREFEVKAAESKTWKKLFKLNRLVAPQSSTGIDFYLTRSPYCSSSLQPNTAALEAWAFRDLFEVERVVKLPAVDLSSALKQIGLDRIDWYKSDSQGTDLRIFKSLPAAFAQHILAADFEPGVLDGYVGEDKLHHLMAHMETLPFWVSDMDVKGTQRIDHAVVKAMNFYENRGLQLLQKTSPGWCEIGYINTLVAPGFGVREHLLAWLFATLKQQHGFALRVASTGASRFAQPLFTELQAHSSSSLALKPARLAYVKLRRLAARVLGRR